MKKSNGNEKSSNGTKNNTNTKHLSTRYNTILHTRKKSLPIKITKNSKKTDTNSFSSSNGHGHNNNSLHSETMSSTSKDEENDPSQINFNYDIRLNGFSSLINIINKSTEKVKKILLHECDIILECRICKNLFRSFPNYISHKEIYCTKNYHPVTTQDFSSLHDQYHINNNNNNNTREKCDETKNYNQKSIRLEKILSKIGSNIEILYNNIQRVNDFKIPFKLKNDINNIKDEIIFQKRIELDPYIRNTNDLYKEELKYNDTAILDGDGKIMFIGNDGVIENIVNRIVVHIDKKNNDEYKRLKLLNCTTCQTVFDTAKSLRIHTRTHCQHKKSKTINSIIFDKKKILLNEELIVPELTSNIELIKKQSIEIQNLEIQDELSKLQEKSLPDLIEIPFIKPLISAPPLLPLLQTLPLNLNEKENNSIENVSSISLENNIEIIKNETSTNGDILKKKKQIPTIIKNIPTSPIFSFKCGRSTNNSFSASLNSMSPKFTSLSSKSSSPVKSPHVIIPLLNPAHVHTTTIPIQKIPIEQNPIKIITRKRTKKIQVKEHENKRTKPIKYENNQNPKSTTTPVLINSCIKCHLNFSNLTQSEICKHLIECNGIINLSLIQESKDLKKSNIQIRHDYNKINTPHLQPLLLPSKPVPPIPNQINTIDKIHSLLKQNGRHHNSSLLLK